MRISDWSSDVCSSDLDPYPRYGAIYSRHEVRCEDYAEEIEESLGELADTRDDAIASATATREELGRQFRERGQIIAARETHRTRYREHQDYLEMVGNTLLSHYRDRKSTRLNSSH